ncbi:MAG: hypothetical protein AVDCRST_MAG49-669, partial [uncultured Thermomicrobiales bacterium]
APARRRPYSAAPPAPSWLRGRRATGWPRGVAHRARPADHTGGI